MNPNCLNCPVGAQGFRRDPGPFFAVLSSVIIEAFKIIIKGGSTVSFGIEEVFFI